MKTGDRHWWYIHKNGHLYTQEELPSYLHLGECEKFEELPGEYFHFNHPYNKLVGGGTFTHCKRIRKILFHIIKLNRLI
jgi:hypothetical protein